jgi:hypothetical protein
MTRWWNELVDAVSIAIPLPLLVLLLLTATIVAGLLWYFFPSWVPRRLPRFGRPRWRWPRLRRRGRWKWTWRSSWLLWWRRRKRKKEPVEPSDDVEPSEHELPDLPVEAFMSLADRLAAEGRYAEAVRERLRAIVRGLVDRGVLQHRPGWTVTELARAAAAARPAVDAPLGEAARVFSDIWYAQRPADAVHDARMRVLAEQVAAAAQPAGVGS